MHFFNKVEALHFIQGDIYGSRRTNRAKRDYIKLPVEILDDPRYGTLTDDLWQLMIQLLLLAGKAGSEGLLPAPRDMAWELRIVSGTLQIALHQLAGRGLVQSTPQGWLVTDFKRFQAAPNSTERSRLFRKRQSSATQNEPECNQDPVQDQTRFATQKRTFGAAEMQPFRHIPVSKPVPKPVSDPGRSGQAARGRPRHRPKGHPVDTCPVDTCPVDTCPVDTCPVEKGRKFSDPDTSSTTSTSSSILTKYLKTSLKIKPLLVLVDRPDLETGPEELDPSPGEDPENMPNMPGSAHIAGEQQVPPARIGPGVEQNWAALHYLREPVGSCPVDKPVERPVDKTVDNSVGTCPVAGVRQEKDRKFSDPEELPPEDRHWMAAFRPACCQDCALAAGPFPARKIRSHNHRKKFCRWSIAHPRI